MEEFDLIVIGAGPGGYVCAIRAAQNGLKVACVEKEKTLGGTCLNWGCIPSKAMLESSHHLHFAQHEAEEHGLQFGEVKFDLAKMLERKNGVVTSITQGVEFLFNKNKVTWLKGTAKILPDQQVEVTGSKGAQVYKTKNAVIATGSIPIELPMAKFDHKKIVDSTDALSFSSVPKHLVVIGGGVIGLELGSVWKRLGSEVTVIEALDKILGPTDKQISQVLMKSLQKQGIKFHMKTMFKGTKAKGKQIAVTCEGKDGEFELVADKVLVAVGRKPYTDGLGLADVGVKQDKRGVVEINDHFQTSQSWIYAIGDAVRGPMLAHKAEEEGVAVADGLSQKYGHVNYRAIPSVVYTWPEVASVGHSEEELKAAKTPIKVGKFYFKANGRAKAMGTSATDGMVKFIADKATDKLLGVHIVGPMASELIAEIAIAFEYGASAEDIARSVHAHPTLAEVLKEGALSVDNRAIHS